MLIASIINGISIVAAELQESTHLDAIIPTDVLQSQVGDAMIATATVAIPIGLGVMAITMGIPLAKKVLKILGR